MKTISRQDALKRLREELLRVEDRIVQIEKVSTQRVGQVEPETEPNNYEYDQDFSEPDEYHESNKSPKNERGYLTIDPSDLVTKEGPMTPLSGNSTQRSTTPKSVTIRSQSQTPKSATSTKSYKSYASRSSTIEETREIASSFNSDDIKSLLNSTIVQQAMARLGLCLTDVLPELQSTRLTLTITDEIATHLEKRRIEALIMILRERERIIIELEKMNQGRPKTANINSKAVPHVQDPKEVCKQFIETRTEKNKKIHEKTERIRLLREEKWNHRCSDQMKKQFDLEEKSKRAEFILEKRREEIKQKLENRKLANLNAKAIQDRLIHERNAALRDKFLTTEKRIENLIKRRNEEQKRQLHEQDREQSSTDLHRSKVREDAKRKEAEDTELKRLQAEHKAQQIKEANQRNKEKAQQEKSKRKLAEIDRIIKLERLHRQSEHRKLKAQQKLEEKTAALRANEELQAMLKREREETERKEMSERLRRHESTGLSDMPGPGSHKIGSLLNEISFSMGAPDLEKQEKTKVTSIKSEPGPGEYSIHPSALYSSRGVAFSRGKVLSEIDWVMKRAAAIPGPGHYAVDSPLGKLVPAASMGDLSSEALKVARSKIALITPGPGAYSPKSLL